MANQIVTLYIDDASLRLVVVSGRQVKRWARLSLQPGLVKGAQIVKEAEVADKVKELLKSQKVKAKSVIVGLSGLHSLTRPMTFAALPKARLAEAVLREARKVLPVPLEQLYVAWQSSDAAENKVRVFMTAVPRQAVDGLVSTLRRVGVRPGQLDLKPLALARGVREPTAIIVDMQPAEFDIVILSDGIPQPIRTVPLVSEDISRAEKLDTIAGDVQRTIDFFNSNNPDKPLSQTVPLYVSGEPAGDPEVVRVLTERLGHPVRAMPSFLSYPPVFEPSSYVVNLCLALKGMRSAKLPISKIANLNALPEAYRAKRFSLARAIAVPLAALAAALIIPMVVLLQGAEANISSMRSQLVSSTKFIGQKNAEEISLKKDIDALQKKASSTEVAYTGLLLVADSLDALHARVDGDFATAMGRLPPGARITKIGYSKAVMTIGGSAAGEDEVLLYARNLRESDRFPEVTVASLVRKDGAQRDAAVEFIIMLRGW